MRVLRSNEFCNKHGVVKLTQRRWTPISTGACCAPCGGTALKKRHRQRNARALLTSKEHFIRSGLWRFSRHPNYFGELCFWWGVFISASQAFSTALEYYCLASPLLITYLLLGASGMPILELNSNKKLRSSTDYMLYRLETSPIIPLPNCLYRSLPTAVKVFLLFEWPLYARGLEDDGSAASIVNSSIDGRALSTSGRSTSISGRASSRSVSTNAAHTIAISV